MEQRADYLVLGNRAWKRGVRGMGYEVYPCVLREWLPCVGVPLKEGEADVPLDLQYAVNRATKADLIFAARLITRALPIRRSRPKTLPGRSICSGLEVSSTDHKTTRNLRLILPTDASGC